jgi:hypothetical protein
VNDDRSEESPRTRLAGRLVLLLLVSAFVGHRLLVILSAGDFLYPLEPSEAKNTQIAWDLMSGRFGEPGYELHNYIVNNGSIHHGSYSSAALAYWLVSRVFGFTLLSVRMVPLLAWTGALLVFGETLRRRVGVTGMALALVGLAGVPTLFIGFQLTFLGCHPESVLPLAAAVASWLAWLDDPKSRVRSLLLGVCVGYATIFSYLLWPFLALMAALSFLPPLPRPNLSALASAAGGVLLGFWPLWLIFGLGGASVLFGSPITENPETTLVETASGMGLDWEEFRVTFWGNLPFGFEDYWMSHPEAPRFDGIDMFFEEVAYRALVFGPLLLLPWAITDRDPLTRRLGILTAVAPILVYSWLAFASPWKPHVPPRYFVPFALFGFAAPGIAVGLGLRRMLWPKWYRVLGLPLLVAGVGWLIALAPHRWHEAMDAVRTEKAEALLEHRYVAYYNLGVGTVWGAMVGDLNDFIDVRAASGDPEAFDGFQAGMWGAGGRLALGRREWELPQFEKGSMRSGLREWAERDSYRNPEDHDEPAHVARNVGWGAGLRAGWNLQTVARTLRHLQGDGDWPEGLAVDDFWLGLGTGYGRARPDATEDDLPSQLSPGERESLVEGMRAGRALGPVPKAPRNPPFDSVRGPAT